MKASKELLRLTITVDLAHMINMEFRSLYHTIYKYGLDYDKYIDKGDELLKATAEDEKLRTLVRFISEVRGDIFTSDREIACLYLILRDYEFLDEDDD